MRHLLLSLLTCCTMAVHAQQPAGEYRNPIIPRNLPDPTVIKADDGYYYLYATENIRHLPIYRSKNLVDWDFVGTAFTRDSRPQWNPKGNLWAPDINRIAGKYVLYYAKSEWGGEWTCGIGVATADKPEGPFTDHGPLFISKDIGVQNSIDGFYIEEDGHKYLFWGSFRGIYGIELSDDGLSVKPGAQKRQIAGTFMEGTYIHKHGRYYYLFGSAGTCCEGEKSTYRVTVGRSENLFGPYVDKEGRSLMDNHYEVILHGSDDVVGPGHNAEFITDNRGQDWIIYHGFSRANPKSGRLVYMDRVEWIDGWPHIAHQEPSTVSERPDVGNITLADPTIFLEDGTYYLYGTSSAKGILVYTSTDMEHWQGPVGATKGHALYIGDAWGTKGFWAPQVFKRNGKYYMAYTANEQIAIAESDSPLGPFRQEVKEHLPATMKQIDPFVFFDDNGKAYLYHVRLINGNRIYVAELNKDLQSMKEKTARECIAADTMTWEDTWKAEWTVTEGPTVVKQGTKKEATYYLFYSCNDFRNPDYAVGYATAKSPLGPWTKFAGNPIISRKNIGLKGTGHGDIFTDKDGKLCYVFHTHHSPTRVGPRNTAVVEMVFNGKDYSVKPETFLFLNE